MASEVSLQPETLVSMARKLLVDVPVTDELETGSQSLTGYKDGGGAMSTHSVFGHQGPPELVAKRQ